MPSRLSSLTMFSFSSDSSTTRSARHRRTGGSASLQATPAYNPKLIFSQILALQCFYYLVLGIIIEVNHVMFATTVTIDRMFTTSYLDIWSVATGWIDNSAVIMSSIVGAVLLAIIVEKSKKCLDFSVTLFVTHTAICTFYDGLPRTWDWWIVHLFGMIIMILLGEFLCSKKELMEIPLL